MAGKRMKYTKQQVRDTWLNNGLGAYLFTEPLYTGDLILIMRVVLFCCNAINTHYSTCQ